MREVVRPITRAVTSKIGTHIPSGGGGGWLPTELAGLLAWYDVGNLSTMWQDSAGSVPVTTTGQPVGRINDLSGNNRHATQGLSPPTLLQNVEGKYYLFFNGFGDALEVTFPNFGSDNTIGYGQPTPGIAYQINTAQTIKDVYTIETDFTSQVFIDGAITGGETTELQNYLTSTSR